MHRLTSSFVLGYHGCDRRVGERLLGGAAFQSSSNDYDWLGPGVYFWEANPKRGFEFAEEALKRTRTAKPMPFVVGAVIELGMCLDLTTSDGVRWVKAAHASLSDIIRAAGLELPTNSGDGLRRNLDCAVLRRLHAIVAEQSLPPIDTVKGVFTEGGPLYPGSGFQAKTHIQIAVVNPNCIKGISRVPEYQFRRKATARTGL